MSLDYLTRNEKKIASALTENIDIFAISGRSLVKEVFMCVANLTKSKAIQIEHTALILLRVSDFPHFAAA